MPQFPSLTSASGIWTLKKQKRAQQGSNWPGFPVYIEDVFSTWLYTGNGSTQTITNGIDLSGKGGMVWVKRRNSPANDHAVMDTARGIATSGAWTLIPNDNFAQFDNNTVTAFNSNGFTLGSSSFGNSGGGFNYASWTFRKQAKFFDMVTYTGDGTNNRQIAHSLGSVPGCIIAKCTSTAQGWDVWHRTFSDTTQDYLQLDTAAAVASFPNVWGTQSATTFTVGSGGSNINGRTYVAYLFAHNAGGFGLTGTDNVISCGAFTTDGSGNATVSLGYEPQWLLIKSSVNFGSWYLVDTMRGCSQTIVRLFFPESNAAEQWYSATPGYLFPTATGFSFNGLSGAFSSSFIYIAIRRGPMKTPTTGTSVFSPVARNGTGAATDITSPGFPPDLVFDKNRGGGGWNWNWFDRLRGAPILSSDNTAAEVSVSTIVQSDWSSTTMLGYRIQNGGEINASGNTYSDYALRRAPGFMDEVCYTGTGSATTQAHNLGIVPEMIIVKSRSNVGVGWPVYHKSITNPQNNVIYLNATAPSGFDTTWNLTAPTSSVFSISGDANVSAWTFVAYLFASCPGVSKVGSYTGTGALQTIDCGFTGGARFVLIKRTDSTGDWFTYDSARGITSGNDPYLLMNSTAAEVTGTNYVDTTSVGFQVTAAAPAGLNASGGTYIFLAIA